jgi:hypothetical protein
MTHVVDSMKYKSNLISTLSKINEDIFPFEELYRLGYMAFIPLKPNAISE